MPGGYGGKDIWRVPVSNSGFGAVENLGDAINTPGNEMFPTIKDNGNLYFSSDGHPGMGGLDLYWAQQDSLGNWKIDNLKSPMNSESDDFGMLCYILWNMCIKHLGAVRTTNYVYIVPLVTLITSSIIINETITPFAIAGALLILSGVYIAEKGFPWFKKIASK